MKKKFLVLGLVLVMLFNFTSCGKREPSVEELRSGIESIDIHKYQDVILLMDVYGVSDGDALALNLSMGFEMAYPVMHIYDGKMSANMEGLSLDAEIEGWSDKELKVSYSRVTALGEDTGWTKSSLADSNDSDLMTDIADIVERLSHAGNSEEMSLEKHEKGSDYVLTWSMDGGDFDEAMGAILTDYTGGGASFASATGRARFDEETRVLKSMSVETVGSETGGFRLAINFMRLNGDESLSIPEQVVEIAVDEYGPITSGENVEILDETEDGADAGMFGGYEEIGETVFIDGVEVNSVNGSDEIMEEIARRMAAAYSDNDGLYLNYYDGMTSLQCLVGDNEWSGCLIVEHIDPEKWISSAEDEYDFKTDWLSGWYEADPYSGDIKSGTVLYAKEDAGRYEMDFVSWKDDLFISANAYSYRDMSYDELLGRLDSMLIAAGLY